MVVKVDFLLKVDFSSRKKVKIRDWWYRYFVMSSVKIRIFRLKIQTSCDIVAFVHQDNFLLCIKKTFQPVFTCSKSTMETPKQCVKCHFCAWRSYPFNVWNLLTSNRFRTLFLCFRCWLLRSKCRLDFLISSHQRLQHRRVIGNFVQPTR